MEEEKAELSIISSKNVPDTPLQDLKDAKEANTDETKTNTTTVPQQRSSNHELNHSKREASTVEFNIPKDRRKSLTGGQEHSGPYRGMGKEELLRYSSKPLWRNLRYVCMSIVLTGWLALLITVVALVLTYPHCRKGQEKDWWQKTVIYRIYVRSFHDTNKDGIGDIKGISQKLDYLEYLGVNTISISPIYLLTNDADTDTHIIDHMAINPDYGTIDDLRHLINETHERGMHILLDFIPNHTSDQHKWFIKSYNETNARHNDYRYYYNWHKGFSETELTYPNNWRSIYNNCSAWTTSRAKDYYYQHLFLSSQPDLNLRSDRVREELEAILEFWLNLGVDGFYIRNAAYLFTDYDLRDNNVINNSTTARATRPACSLNDPDPGPVYFPYSAYDNKYTSGLEELFDMLARWRAYLDEYGDKSNKYKMLVADGEGSYDDVIRYYGIFNRDGVDVPLNTFMLHSNSSTNGNDVADFVNNWMKRMPSGRWANWMTGHDRSERMTDRIGHQMSRPFAMLTMLLPGTPFLYYGDEINIQEKKNYAWPKEQWKRKKAMRGPMQWSNNTLMGFCDPLCTDPWVPVNEKAPNVDAQKADPYSMLRLIRNLTELRKDNPSFEYGDFILSHIDDEVFSFVREFDGEKGYLVALNFANSTVRKSFTGRPSTVPGSGKVEVVSGGPDSHYSKGDGAGLDPLKLQPYEGIVVSWDYKAKEL